MLSRRNFIELGLAGLAAVPFVKSTKGQIVQNDFWQGSLKSEYYLTDTEMMFADLSDQIYDIPPDEIPDLSGLKVK